MSELVIDFITSLDGYASAEGWPGWWGLEGPEYLAWLGERPDSDYTLLMGASCAPMTFTPGGRSYDRGRHRNTAAPSPKDDHIPVRRNQ